MKISVLGPAGVAAGGEPEPLGSRRQRQVLAALVLRRDRSTSPEELADLVWGDAAPNDPLAAVHTAVSRLRRTLPGGVTVVTGPGGYQLACAPGQVDVDVVAQALQQWRELAPLDAAAACDDALRLWRGEPYADLDHPHATTERTRLTELRVLLAEARASSLVAAGHVEDAVICLRLVVGEHPAREEAVAALMEALVVIGR